MYKTHSQPSPRHEGGVPLQHHLHLERRQGHLQRRLGRPPRHEVRPLPRPGGAHILGTAPWPVWERSGSASMCLNLYTRSMGPYPNNDDTWSLILGTCCIHRCKRPLWLDQLCHKWGCHLRRWKSNYNCSSGWHVQWNHGNNDYNKYWRFAKCVRSLWCFTCSSRRNRWRLQSSKWKRG